MGKLIDGVRIGTSSKEILFLKDMRRMDLLEIKHIKQAIGMVKQDLETPCKIGMAVSKDELEIVVFPIHEQVESQITRENGRLQLIVDETVEEDISLFPEFIKERLFEEAISTTFQL